MTRRAVNTLRKETLTACIKYGIKTPKIKLINEMVLFNHGKSIQIVSGHDSNFNKFHCTRPKQAFRGNGVAEGMKSRNDRWSRNNRYWNCHVNLTCSGHVIGDKMSKDPPAWCLGFQNRAGRLRSMGRGPSTVLNLNRSRTQIPCVRPTGGVFHNSPKPFTGDQHYSKTGESWVRLTV